MTWPNSDVSTANVDAGTDSPASARAQLLDLINKFNELRNHVSAFSQTLLDDADAATARATLGLGGASTLNVGTGLTAASGNLTNPSAFGLLESSNSTGTLVAADAGDLVVLTAGVTVPANVFTARQTVTLYNNSASAITITQGASLTLRQVGSANIGNRTLAQRGLATVVFSSATEAVISGGGLT